MYASGVESMRRHQKYVDYEKSHPMARQLREISKRQLAENVLQRDGQQQAQFVIFFADLLQGLFGGILKNVSLRTAVFELYEQIRPDLERIVKKAIDVLGIAVREAIKALLPKLVELLSQVAQALLSIVGNIVGEVVKYLVFGFVGGPWATLIPLVLEILGPVIEVVDGLDETTIRAGVAASTRGLDWFNRGAEPVVQKGLGLVRKGYEGFYRTTFGLT